MTTAADETTDAGDVLIPLASVAAGIVLALLAVVLIRVLVRSVARRSPIAADLSRRSRNPLRAVLVVVAIWVALRISVPAATWQDSDWMGVAEHLLLIALIGTGTWLVGSLAFVVEDAALSRYRVDVKDNRRARRVRTQIQLLRRITVALLVVIAVAAVLLTFPGVSAFGASILASAGVLSIVAGLAAQSSLANVFAGLQLAFTDAIRVDDVVIVEQEWGRIEEITLTYVVVHVWDDRRLILPSTHFTQTPFENWTRRAAELLGTVEFDLDWQVPVDRMRAELNRLLAATDLWDHRVGVLQVTDAVGGTVRLRALASAADAPTLFDLRCYLREGLVAWLQRTAPEGLPRTRFESAVGMPVDRATTEKVAAGAALGDDDHALADGQQDARLFTGSVAARERSRSFAGPGEGVIAEREEHAAGPGAEDRSGDAHAFADTDRVVLPAQPLDSSAEPFAPSDEATAVLLALSGERGQEVLGTPDAAGTPGPGGAELAVGTGLADRRRSGVDRPDPDRPAGELEQAPRRRSVRSSPIDPRG